MINQNFVILGILIHFLGGTSYIINTLKGKVQPNRVSWGLWAFASFIAFAAEIQQKVGLQSLMTFMVGFIPFLIFCASFLNKNAYWKLGLFDFFCGALSLLGLFLWLTTRIGSIAIVCSIFADFTAGIPTLVKSYRFPESENYIVFLSTFISSLLTILTLKQWTFAYLGFPLYIFLFEGTAAILILFKIGKKFDVR